MSVAIPTVDPAAVVDSVLTWYEHSARDLPWRRPGTSPWAIVVSEFMLQQTPVTRVLQPWSVWVTRWPTPAALACEPVGEAVRAWGRLGYPRRALRLHSSAQLMVERYHGEVPRRLEDLRGLPGIGPYTAAAIASFAFGDRHCVLDTNVRRVLCRLVDGQATAPRSINRVEQEMAERFVPDSPHRAAQWAVAAMELGALVCTARSPQCARCPVSTYCRWRSLGAPASATVRAAQSYEGTDRQCRGVLLARLRAAEEPVSIAALRTAWTDDAQRERCLASLMSDGLAVGRNGGRIALPD